MPTSTPHDWTLRPALPEDVEVIAELRAVVMRPDLERLGRYDGRRVRQRLRDSYAPEHTSIVEAMRRLRGMRGAAVTADGWWLESFLLSPALQGHGIGSAVLRTLLDRADAERVPVRLNVLRGSAARRLYERHGFALEREDPVDVFLVREPAP